MRWMTMFLSLTVITLSALGATTASPDEGPEKPADAGTTTSAAATAEWTSSCGSYYPSSYRVWMDYQGWGQTTGSLTGTKYTYHFEDSEGHMKRGSMGPVDLNDLPYVSEEVTWKGRIELVPETDTDSAEFNYKMQAHVWQDTLPMDDEAHAYASAPTKTCKW